MRLPLLVACGLLAASVAALAISIADHGDRSVANLVTVPGVTQVAANSGFGLAAPSGTSPYANYVAPANPPSPTAAPAHAAPAPPPTAATAPVPKVDGGSHHRRG